MPKTLEYPRSSFKNALEIAQAVHSLGGKCDEETCANKLGKKTSGAFSKKISSTVKHGLIITNKGSLEVSELYKSIINAYTDEEKNKFLIEAFFNASTYKKVYDRFKGNKLPIDILDKLLIREYEVNNTDAPVISKYLIEGLKFLNLISPDEKILETSLPQEEDKDLSSENANDEENSNNNLKTAERAFDGKLIENPINNSYQVKVTGPGINSSIEIISEDDLIILNAIISKIKKGL